MSCPKRPIKRKFLFWEYQSEEPHIWRLVSFEHAFEQWHLSFRCNVCGCERVITTWNDEQTMRLLGELPTGESYSWSFTNWIPEDKQKVYDV